MLTTTLSPGKIILSGEHSVLYGQPAIAMAISTYAKTSITNRSDQQFSVNLKDFDINSRLTLKDLAKIQSAQLKRYRDFLKGEISARQILEEHTHLFFCILFHSLRRLNRKFGGLQINLGSDIMIGSGMGSSAATIVGLAVALNDHLGLGLSKKMITKLALKAESLIHGFSSGLDIYTSAYGGCLKLQNGQMTQLNLPNYPYYIIHTGTPQSTTGDCVEYVKNNFESNSIWSEFGDITCEIETLLTVKEIEKIVPLLKENHKLLTQIGIVPEKAQRFISKIEQKGGAAKVCGAGAIHGESAGILLAVSNEPIEDLCNEFGYTILPSQGDPLGARVI